MTPTPDAPHGTAYPTPTAAKLPDWMHALLALACLCLLGMGVWIVREERLHRADLSVSRESIEQKNRLIRSMMAHPPYGPGWLKWQVEGIASGRIDPFSATAAPRGEATPAADRIADSLARLEWAAGSIGRMCEALLISAGKTQSQVEQIRREQVDDPLESLP